MMAVGRPPALPAGVGEREERNRSKDSEELERHCLDRANGRRSKMSDDTAMNYDRLRTLATKIEELIKEFQEVPGFWFHQERLRQSIDGLRNYERIDQWVESRKELGKQIDPVRAEVFCTKGWVLDVY
jgi:hypothetical protein